MFRLVPAAESSVVLAVCGLTTKIHGASDRRCRTLAVYVTAGQTHGAEYVDIGATLVLWTVGLLLRPGNAAATTVGDDVGVLEQALQWLPGGTAVVARVARWPSS